MIVKSAEFVISNTDVHKCPTTGLPEFAFIGRSNVGKSSLINMLTNRRNLAMTSSKPGKTLLINHFIINNDWYLVDLPGYGFASAGKSTKDKLRKIIDSYILLRDQLTCLFLLIDCRHEPQKIDVDFMNWLGMSGIPFAIVFTKADKLTKSQLNSNMNHYREKLSETWEEIPPVFITSSDTGQGKEELLQYIEEINNSLNK